LFSDTGGIVIYHRRLRYLIEIAKQILLDLLKGVTSNQKPEAELRCRKCHPANRYDVI